MKLEQVGDYRLVRPALNAVWAPSLTEKEWHEADAVFTRDAGGNGKWSYRRPLPESWHAEWGGLIMLIKPTSFGHLGFFAEQFRNWDFFRSLKYDSALNLFAYSGLGSLAMAENGAKVCHLDAAKGMVEWAKQNLALNRHIPENIRWIVDDVNKFIRREERRGSKYQLIALDPPSFGRGSSGQLWKIESDIIELLKSCRRLQDEDKQFTLVLSCHSPGFSVKVLERCVRQTFGSSGVFSSAEMSIPESISGNELPAGICVRWQSC
jgi:23S rRNA (cytosine1962-C5)-methyltransferase